MCEICDKYDDLLRLFGAVRVRFESGKCLISTTPLRCVETIVTTVSNELTHRNRHLNQIKSIFIQ